MQDLSEDGRASDMSEETTSSLNTSDYSDTEEESSPSDHETELPSR